MIGQMQYLQSAAKEQPIAWSYIDPDPWRHMVSLSHIVLMQKNPVCGFVICRCQFNWILI